MANGMDFESEDRDLRIVLESHVRRTDACARYGFDENLISDLVEALRKYACNRMERGLRAETWGTGRDERKQLISLGTRLEEMADQVASVLNDGLLALHLLDSVKQYLPANDAELEVYLYDPEASASAFGALSPLTETHCALCRDERVNSGSSDGPSSGDHGSLGETSTVTRERLIAERMVDRMRRYGRALRAVGESRDLPPGPKGRPPSFETHYLSEVFRALRAFATRCSSQQSVFAPRSRAEIASELFAAVGSSKFINSSTIAGWQLIGGTDKNWAIELDDIQYSGDKLMKIYEKSPSL